MSFTCPRCGMTSGHPDDERQGYCGNCHDWTAVGADGSDRRLHPGEDVTRERLRALNEGTGFTLPGDS
jgi:predicted ATP-dependent serine protease